MPVGQYFARLADSVLVVGRVYPLLIREERSSASHNHYFAAITEAWRNLPEPLLERFQSSEHLRKYALIKAGYAEERSIVCASKAEAQRLAGFIRPMDDFAVVMARDCVVTVWTAKSQSYRAMGRADFERSKQAVLDYAASLIGSTPAALAANAGAAA